MNAHVDQLAEQLLTRLHEVQSSIGLEPAQGADTLLADAVDSMALVEFLALVAEDYGVTVETIEQTADRQYSTLRKLATDLWDAGYRPTSNESPRPAGPQPGSVLLDKPACWLAAVSSCLPRRRQSAEEIDALLARPPGWLAEHAGIVSRCIWTEEDILAETSRAVRQCLDSVDVPMKGIEALLVTSEAPPMYPGCAAALHHHLGLPASCPAIEVGNACMGFLSAMWTAQHLLVQRDAVVIVSVEAPSRWLSLAPGPSGETAALLGDAASATLLTSRPTDPESVPLSEIVLRTDGSQQGLLEVTRCENDIVLSMDGGALATRALHALSQVLADLTAAAGIGMSDLTAVVMHAGNGRLPGILARQLGVPASRIHSLTSETGNLGSASLPVAWSAHPPTLEPTAWLAVGPGLQWGGALSGSFLLTPRSKSKARPLLSL